MKVTLLGTGTSTGIPLIGCPCWVCTSPNPLDKRLRSACLVEFEGLRLVVDVGPDFRQQMLNVGGKEIHALLVTHEHTDHVVGLDDVRPYNFLYRKNIPLYALPRVTERIKHVFSYIFDKDPYPGSPQIELCNVGDSPFHISHIKITPIEVMHGKLPILGYRIHDFTYITDAKFISEREIEKIKGSKVLIVNALRQEEHHSHFTLQEALDFIEKIKPEQAYLTHISHWLGRYEEVQPTLPKGVFLGYDGLTLELD